MYNKGFQDSEMTWSAAWIRYYDSGKNGESSYWAKKYFALEAKMMEEENEKAITE